MKLRARVTDASWPRGHTTIEAHGATLGRALRTLGHRLKRYREESTFHEEGDLAYVATSQTYYQLSRVSVEVPDGVTILPVVAGQGCWLCISE